MKPLHLNLEPRSLPSRSTRTSTVRRGSCRVRRATAPSLMCGSQMGSRGPRRPVFFHPCLSSGPGQVSKHFLESRTQVQKAKEQDSRGERERKSESESVSTSLQTPQAASTSRGTHTHMGGTGSHGPGQRGGQGAPGTLGALHVTPDSLGPVAPNSRQRRETPRCDPPGTWDSLERAAVCRLGPMRRLGPSACVGCRVRSLGVSGSTRWPAPAGPLAAGPPGQCGELKAVLGGLQGTQRSGATVRLQRG